MRKLLSACLASCLLALPATWALAKGDKLQLKEGHPQEYVVVKGDTLWDISGRFLQKPWRWPEIWGINKQIADPHWIYPGDVIYLTWVDGQPRLQVKGDGKGDGRLQPRVRVTPLDSAIPAIALKDLNAFLSDNAVLEDELLRSTPYVIGNRNQSVIAGAGDRVYAKGSLEDTTEQQNIYRPAREYVDPITGELLGYELHKVAESRVSASNDDVISLDIIRSNMEIRVQDRVLPAPEGRVQSAFYPAAAPADAQGVILAVLRGVNKIGRYDGVAINLGQRDGIEPGHVFIVKTQGEQIKDPVSGAIVQLPSENAGTLMVFKSYDKVSYALMMTATNVMSVGDPIRSPDAGDEPDLR